MREPILNCLIYSALSALPALLLAPAPLLHALAPSSVALATSPTNQDAAYSEGIRAMDEQRWPDAISAFDKVIDVNGNKGDAALYWKAYSLNKLGDSGLAIATCLQLRSRYVESRWNNDCGALLIDIQAKSASMSPPPSASPGSFSGPGLNEAKGSAVRGPGEDLKVLALNGLLRDDPARAAPIARSILSGSQSMRLKRDVLFALGQSKAPEAATVINDAVIGKMGLEIQNAAIQAIAVSQGKRAEDMLAGVYRSTSVPSVKRSIISAFFIMQDAPRMVEIARNEKDLRLKRYIVSELALMHDKAATEYMMELLK